MQEEDRKYILDIARPSAYAYSRFKRENGGQSLVELLQLKYDRLSADLVLEYLDEIITNHNQTTDEMVRMDPRDLQRADPNPWKRDGQKIPKTISVS